MPYMLMKASAPLRATLCCVLVLVVALCCFFVNRAEPPHIFWDENYHVTSAQHYLANVAHFEPHPPLGPMLIALGELLSAANVGIDKQALVRVKQIGGEELPPGFSFAGMRLMPSLFATLGAVLFFALMYQLVEHRLHALLLTSLYVFENAFVVHFRAVHLDSFQMFFGIAVLWQFVRLWRKPQPLHEYHYAGLAALCGLAIMVKVNAALLLVLLPMLYLKDARRHPRSPPPAQLMDFVVKSGCAAAALLLVVFTTFYVHTLHTRQLPDPDTPAGQQDLANMSSAYFQFLEQRQAVTPAIVFVIARDYFRFMDKDHAGVPKLDVTKPGENGSHPLRWPFHDKKINYRWDASDGKTRYVQLIGNQVSWYCGTAAVFLSLLLVINYRVFAIPLRGSIETYRLIEIFVGLYSVFMLLHLWIITQRVLYLYHYFLGLMISYVLLALFWRYLCEAYSVSERRRAQMLAAGASIILLSYWFFLPLSNHWPLTKEECERRNMSLTRIVDCI